MHLVCGLLSCGIGLQLSYQPKYSCAVATGVHVLTVAYIKYMYTDEGGPRRELFSHLIKEAMQQPMLFTGWPEHLIPVYNINAIFENKYYVIGKMIATSLIQGGQPPLCFSTAVADFIIYDSVRSKPCIDDIPDHYVREEVRELSMCNT